MFLILIHSGGSPHVRVVRTAPPTFTKGVTLWLKYQKLSVFLSEQAEANSGNTECFQQLTISSHCVHYNNIMRSDTLFGKIFLSNKFK